MNTAARTKDKSRRQDANSSGKLKLVPNSDQPSTKSKFRIGICEGLFSARPDNAEVGPLGEGSNVPLLPREDLEPIRPSGKWIAFAAVGFIIGLFVGSRRK